MKKYALLLLLPLAGLAACQTSAPPPPPGPQTTEIIGMVRDMSGNCHIIVADNGTTYALRPGVLPPEARPGARVRVVGVVDPSQGCPGATMLRADGGVTILAEAAPPPPRRMGRVTTVPK
jgi:hypothetical protein